MSHWCKSHPRYEAKREPNSVCGDCWHLWHLKNPELKMENRDRERPSEQVDFATLDVVEEL